MLLALADLRYTLLDELRESVRRLEPAPVNVTLFGSFTRSDDDASSDIDVVFVRPSAIDEEDCAWSESIIRWEAHTRRITGNPVSRVEVGEHEVAKLMRSRRTLWQEIRRESITLLGIHLDSCCTCS